MKEEKLKELFEKLDKIETHIFMIDMIDRWDKEDEKTWDRLQEEKRKIEEEIKELENAG